MNKLNRKVEYSLVALKHIGQKKAGELTTAKEISDLYKTPFDATARVLQVMAQKGVLKSEQGVNGGYYLIKNLEKLNLEDLLSMIQGPTQIAKCMHHSDPCEIKKNCNIISPVFLLNEKLTQFYKGLSLKELLNLKSQSVEIKPHEAAHVS